MIVLASACENGLITWVVIGVLSMAACVAPGSLIGHLLNVRARRH